MAESIPSASTFDALTDDYKPRVLIDNIFTGSPTWNYIKQNMFPLSGRTWQPLIEYAGLTGEWYERADKVEDEDALVGDIATRASYVLRMFRQQVLLAAPDVDMQGTESLIDLMKAYVRNASESIRSQMTTSLFTTVAKGFDGLDKMCDNVINADYGGLNPDADSLPTWVAHVMEGEADNGNAFGVAVSPWIENIARMRRAIIETCGQGTSPDICVVQSDYYDKLAAYVGENQYLIAKAANASNQVVKWGFDALFCNDMPIVSERACPGAPWVAGQATRALAKGYQAFLVNFDHCKLGFNSKRAFKWDPGGWVRPRNFDGYENWLYVWANLGTDMRRAQGRIFNVDIAQESGYTYGTVDIPGA